jgi:metallophosphoesterase (TIGR00282 family)
MRILTVGDVVGTAGCDCLRRVLPMLKRQKEIDFTIVNGENAAPGNGILPQSAEHIFASGADVITSGNHIFRRREIYPLLDENEFILRPHNFPVSAPGRGVGIYDMGRVKIAVINLMGVVYLEPLACPFETADSCIEYAKKEGAKIILVDLHAEATSEKRALGFYLDGKISALFGTHTHVQTADETILPRGTGYITDLGMTGPKISVLGVKPEIAIAKQKEKLPVRFEIAEGECVVSGCIFDIEEKTGKTISVERISIEK